MKQKKTNRRGEITTAQIVTLVVLIASVIVIFLFWNRADFFGTADLEICHNSVVTRTNMGSLPLASKESIPLQCKTDYVCISKDGTCETMTSPIIKKVKTSDDVYNVLAEQMADCWWMFGEGKLDYVGETQFSTLMCSLCYQTSFDNSLKEIFESGEIDRNEFYTYLSSTNMSGGSITYLDYLSGLTTSQAIKESMEGQGFTNVLYFLQTPIGVDLYFRYDGEIWSWTYLNPGESLDAIPEKYWQISPDLSVTKDTEIISSLTGKNLEEGEIILTEKGATEYETIVNMLDSDFGTISLDKKYFVVMGIFSKVNEWQWAIYGAAGAVAGTALAVVTGGASIPATIAIIVSIGGGGAGGYFIGTAIQGISGRRYLSPTIIEASSEDFEKLDCGSIRTLA